jgi:16S rRNA processing protein RimM
MLSADSNRIVIGRITGEHGMRGGLQVSYSGDGPENLLRADHVIIGSRVDDPDAVLKEVLSAAPGRTGEVRMTLAGVEGREAARELRRRLVMIEAGKLEPLAEGEWYEFDLIGCRVETQDGEDIGTVREVWSTGPSDVLVVAKEEGGQHLIPTGGDFLQEVDLDGRRIVVNVIPGLLDTP